MCGKNTLERQKTKSTSSLSMKNATDSVSKKSATARDLSPAKSKNVKTSERAKAVENYNKMIRNENRNGGFEASQPSLDVFIDDNGI